MFYLCTHRIKNCLRTADFYCVHGTHRSDISMRTWRKNVHTYAVHIVNYFAAPRIRATWILIAQKPSFLYLKFNNSTNFQVRGSNIVKNCELVNELSHEKPG